MSNTKEQLKGGIEGLEATHKAEISKKSPDPNADKFDLKKAAEAMDAPIAQLNKSGYAAEKTALPQPPKGHVITTAHITREDEKSHKILTSGTREPTRVLLQHNKEHHAVGGPEEVKEYHMPDHKPDQVDYKPNLKTEAITNPAAKASAPSPEAQRAQYSIKTSSDVMDYHNQNKHEKGNTAEMAQRYKVPTDHTHHSQANDIQHQSTLKDSQKPLSEIASKKFSEAVSTVAAPVAAVAQTFADKTQDVAESAKEAIGSINHEIEKKWKNLRAAKLVGTNSKPTENHSPVKDKSPHGKTSMGNVVSRWISNEPIDHEVEANSWARFEHKLDDSRYSKLPYTPHDVSYFEERFVNDKVSNKLPSDQPVPDFVRRAVLDDSKIARVDSSGAFLVREDGSQYYYQTGHDYNNDLKHRELSHLNLPSTKNRESQGVYGWYEDSPTRFDPKKVLSGRKILGSDNHNLMRNVPYLTSQKEKGDTIVMQHLGKNIDPKVAQMAASVEHEGKYYGRYDNGATLPRSDVVKQAFRAQDERYEPQQQQQYPAYYREENNSPSQRQKYQDAYQQDRYADRRNQSDEYRQYRDNQQHRNFDKQGNYSQQQRQFYEEPKYDTSQQSQQQQSQSRSPRSSWYEEAGNTNVAHNHFPNEQKNIATTKEIKESQQQEFRNSDTNRTPLRRDEYAAYENDGIRSEDHGDNKSLMSILKDTANEAKKYVSRKLSHMNTKLADINESGSPSRRNTTSSVSGNPERGSTSSLLGSVAPMSVLPTQEQLNKYEQEQHKFYENRDDRYSNYYDNRNANDFNYAPERTNRISAGAHIEHPKDATEGRYVDQAQYRVQQQQQPHPAPGHRFNQQSIEYQTPAKDDEQRFAYQAPPVAERKFSDATRKLLSDEDEVMLNEWNSILKTNSNSDRSKLLHQYDHQYQNLHDQQQQQQQQQKLYEQQRRNSEQQQWNEQRNAQQYQYDDSFAKQQQQLQQQQQRSNDYHYDAATTSSSPARGRIGVTEGELESTAEYLKRKPFHAANENVQVTHMSDDGKYYSRPGLQHYNNPDFPYETSLPTLDRDVSARSQFAFDENNEYYKLNAYPENKRKLFGMIRYPENHPLADKEVAVGVPQDEMTAFLPM